LAIASYGGHWKQLRRLDTFLSNYNTTYITTNKDVKLKDETVHYVIDANQNEKVKLIFLFIQSFILFIRIWPDTVITTGAAPGLFMVVLAKIFNKKSIWIDSIANAKKLSLSGELSKRFSTHTLSQWDNVSLAESVEYKGKLLK